MGRRWETGPLRPAPSLGDVIASEAKQPRDTQAPVMSRRPWIASLRSQRRWSASGKGEDPFLADMRSVSASPKLWCRSRRSPACSNRPQAQTAMPRTSGEGSDRCTRALAARSGSPELPMAISTLRRKRSRPVRLTGVPAKKARNPASSREARNRRSGAARSSRAASRVSAACRANLFQGQTARQSSQPNTRLPMAGRSGAGIGP